MSDQARLDAYSEGFDDGYDGYINANPYYFFNSPEQERLWEAYEKGHREGVAEKKRVGNAEPTT